MNQKDVILTGARPTGQLHIGNYLGAIKPIIGLSNEYKDVRLFTATLHSFTDQDPRETVGMVTDLIRDYLAAGVDPERVILFDQMSIAKEISLTTLYLARLVTVARLTLIPTLKDKLKADADSGSANGLLLFYPVMMAADIILQNTTLVPVGVDQQSHVEFARDVVKKMRSSTKQSGLLTMPDGLVQQSLNILALDGSGKMSKTKPTSAIFLGESDMDKVAKKIKQAVTGDAGCSTLSFESLCQIGRGLALDDFRESFDGIVSEHMQGKRVMKQFKDALMEIIWNFITAFRDRRKSVSDELISKVLTSGAEAARHTANSVLRSIEIAMTGN